MPFPIILVDLPHSCPVLRMWNHGPRGEFPSFLRYKAYLIVFSLKNIYILCKIYPNIQLKVLLSYILSLPNIIVYLDYYIKLGLL